ncbi:unnamed protein product, partial [marine sediment metagenome]
MTKRTFVLLAGFLAVLLLPAFAILGLDDRGCVANDLLP